MTTDPKERKGWPQLLNQVLQRREDDRAFRARLRRGGEVATESYAYGDVLPYLPNRDTQRQAMLKVCALAASFPELPQVAEKTYKPFGVFCYEVSAAHAEKRPYWTNDDGYRERSFPVSPDEPDAIASRLAFLHQLELEQAYATIRGILALGKEHGIAVNYYDLARLLLDWGTSTNPQSRDHRLQVIRDYYGGPVPRSTASTTD